MALKSVSRDAVVYGVGVVAQRLATILLLPIYTRLLTPRDYGLIELLQLSVEITTILVSAGTMSGVLRFYYKRQSEEDRHELMASVFVLLGSLNLFGSILLVGAAGLVHRHVLGGEGEVWFLYLVAGSLAASTATIVPQSLMQARREPAQFVASSVSILILQVTLNIVFVVWMRLGVLGVLTSQLVTAVIGGCVLSVWMFRKTGFSIRLSTVRELRDFGVPYQIAQAGGFVLTFGDRLFLQSSQGVGVVGIYGLAYKFGLLTVTMGFSPFFRAWSPQLYAAATLPRAERDEQYDRGFRLLSLLLLTVGTSLSLGARPLLRVIADPAFLGAADVVPWLVVAYIVQGWTGFARLGINVSERTTFHTIAVWVSVLSILFCYGTLIPRYGALGAAWSTLIGFSIRFVLTHYFAQRLWPVTVRWWPHFLALAVCSGAIVIGHQLARNTSLLFESALAIALTGSSLMASFVILVRPAERVQVMSMGRAWLGNWRYLR